MTMVPMTGLKFSPNPYLAAEWPGAYLGMGLTAENVAEKYGVSRSDNTAASARSSRGNLLSKYGAISIKRSNK